VFPLEVAEPALFRTDQQADRGSPCTYDLRRDAPYGGDSDPHAFCGSFRIFIADDCQFRAVGTVLDSALGGVILGHAPFNVVALPVPLVEIALVGTILEATQAG